MRIAADDNNNVNDNDNDDDSDFEFNFDNLFNDGSEDERPKSDIEKMVTEPMDIDNFDPFQESETEVNNRVNNELIQNTFNILSNDARGLLKRMEDFKFKVIQAINMLNGDPELKTKVEQKKKILESAAGQIYGIVFDLENYNLTPNYEDEQLAGESFPAMDINDDLESGEIDNDIDVDAEDENEDENEEAAGDESMPDLGKENSELLQGGFDDLSMPAEGESEET